MKIQIKTVKLSGTVAKSAVAGGYDECMGHGTNFRTKHSESGESWQMADNGDGQLTFPLEGLCGGAIATLDIPSGRLQGVIQDVLKSGDRVDVTLEDVTWEGKEAGLLGGLSCLFYFQAELPLDPNYMDAHEDVRVTESFLLPDGMDIPFFLYASIKGIREEIGGDESAKKVFEFIQKLIRDQKMVADEDE